MLRTYHLRARADGGALYNPVMAHGGATVIATGEIGSGQVEVRVAWCNPTDTYSKRRGAAIASGADRKIIPLRSLPGFLGRTYREVQRRAKTGKPAYHQDLPKFDNRVFDFLPKDLSVEESKPVLSLVRRDPILIEAPQAA